MHDKVKGFLAALHHDGKKLLLNRKREEESYYASWGSSQEPGSSHISSHTFWDRLADHGDPSDLGPWAMPSLPLPQDVVTLIKLMGGWDEEKLRSPGDADPRPTTDDVKRFLPRLLVSLRAADALHKAMYYGDEEKADSSGVQQNHVARQFPFYYPFYGQPVVWTPHPDQFPASVTSAPLRATHKADNPRPLFKDLLDALARSSGLQAKPLLEFQAERLGSFPESTYFPVTSIGFHQRLVATLFLLLYQELEQCCFRSQRENLKPDLVLNTVISPPERLTNRLRDTATVRKISHLVQHQLHAYFQEHYLQDLGELNIWRPDHNLFFFYTKDVIIVLNRAVDQPRIEEICREVAQSTESVITIESLRIEASLPLKLKTNPPSLPVTLDQIQGTEVSMGQARAFFRGTTSQALWQPRRLPPIQSPEEAPDCCASCNKATDRQDLKSDEQRGDMLCSVCLRLRTGHPYCTQCHVYVSRGVHVCPYCNQSAPVLKSGERPPSPRVLHGHGDTGEGHRVAYVAIRINASHDVVRDEAEVLLARFRRDRLAFEKKAGVEQQALEWNCARVRPTRDGIFEYLQAAQDIARFQGKLLEALQESWAEASRRQRISDRSREKARGQFRIENKDLDPENLHATFLYRSPTLTLLVMPEQVLPDFYRALTALLGNLQLSHAVRIVACRHNQPVWMALRDLGVHEPFTPPGATQQTETIETLRQARQNLLDGIDPLESLRRQLQGKLDSLKSRGQSLPGELKPLRDYVGKSRDFISVGSFIPVENAVRQAQQWTKLQPATEIGEFDKLLTDLLMLRAEAIDQARRVLTVGNNLLQQDKEAHTASGSSHTLTVLRSGVQRSYKGRIISFLLQEVPQSHLRTAHQLGSLAEYSQSLLERVRALPTERNETFWKNFGLEWDTRTRWRGKERLPEQVRELVEKGIDHLRGSIDQVPGLLLEIALRQQDAP
ncbi:MAG: hypothetical protein HY268_11385 [Deltaproteobacteria bacterium]|nr:hypothetical protein [Deltaproteobacteria bacterium]